MSSVARIGTEFAGYRIEALVGRGGTSTVYRAENPRLGIRIALKILNPDAAEDEAFRERFVRESRLAAAMNHPNIITIYDAGVWDDALFIAMRYVSGGDLKTRLRDGPLAVERTLSITAQVASGLDAAHARGLIHRDIKPANVMVDSGPRPDAPEIAYVTDFGLIKQAHSGGRATASGEFLGTIDYVAPEQIEGRPVDARADVYSLGCVTFECLTGRVPFERESDAAILWAHMQDDPPVVTAVRAELPAGVDRVIAKAMAKSPGDRFASCGEFIATLKEELEPQTTRRAALTLPVRRPSPPPSRWNRVAAVLAAVALGAGGASAAFLAADRERAREAVTVTRATTLTRTVNVRPEEAPAAYIPESFRASCKARNPPTPDFDESFVCRPRKGVEAVSYSHALSGPLLTGHFLRSVEREGLPLPEPGERLATVGSCDGRLLPAVEEWEAFGRAGHEAIGRTTFGTSDGRVLCHISGGRAHIEWTTSILGVYAHAYGREYRTVHGWWRRQGGPVR